MELPVWHIRQNCTCASLYMLVFLRRMHKILNSPCGPLGPSVDALTYYKKKNSPASPYRKGDDVGDFFVIVSNCFQEHGKNVLHPESHVPQRSYEQSGAWKKEDDQWGSQQTLDFGQA